MLKNYAWACALFVVSASSVFGQQRFSQLTGSLRPGPVQATSPIPVPFITWGGDVATFHANGGLNTAGGSIYQQMGLNLKLTPGDDFVGQVKNYVSGKTPFIRGTMRMLGQASEVIGSDPNTKPVVILQLSWSAGDHIVARENIKSLNDLKSKSGRKMRIACQQGGPHVGLLYDSLDSAQISKDDVEIVWVKDLTGPNGPADAFRNAGGDNLIDACCVITPDLLGLCGDFDSVGSGAEGTVEGAHMLNSTQSMNRSIADVYAVRNDWYQKNKPLVEKFVAGYLKATEQTVAMRKEFDTSGKMSGDYKKLLTTAQNTFGKEVIPTLEVDAHGLLLDCGFVGLPGQISFFEDAGNLNNFQRKSEKALDLATSWGYASNRMGFGAPSFDYKQVASTAGIKYVAPAAGGGRFAAETIDFGEGAELDDKTIVSFTISFEPNQDQFPASQYAAEFNRAVQAASTFGNAVVVVRGHSDPTQTLRQLVKAGQEKGIMKRVGQPGNYRYMLNGRPLDMNAIGPLTELIKRGSFEGTEFKPKETMQQALNLSHKRAEAVKNALIQFAKQQQVNLDVTQMQPVGAGIMEPVIPKPRSIAEAKENMRVEFRIVRVPAEAIKESDFDF